MSDPTRTADPTELAETIATLTERLRQLQTEIDQQQAARLPELVAMIECGIEDPDADEIGARAAKMLAGSTDPRAVDVLVRAVETCTPGDLLLEQAIFALVAAGEPALEPVLARVQATDPDDDVCYAWFEILSQLGVADERIFDHLVRALEIDPPFIASCLANYGDRRALLLVHREFEAMRLTGDPQEDHWVLDMADAIDRLGGVLTDTERRKLSAFELARDRPRSARKLGRNEPCWCGSGKKYKRCHEASDRDDEE